MPHEDGTRALASTSKEQVNNQACKAVELRVVETACTYDCIPIMFPKVNSSLVSHEDHPSMIVQSRQEYIVLRNSPHKFNVLLAERAVQSHR